MPMPTRLWNVGIRELLGCHVPRLRGHVFLRSISIPIRKPKTCSRKREAWHPEQPCRPPFLNTGSPWVPCPTLAWAWHPRHPHRHQHNPAIFSSQFLVRAASYAPRTQPPPPDPLIRKTCKRHNVPGHAHFLTFSCFQRRPFLGRDRRARLDDRCHRARPRAAPAGCGGVGSSCPNMFICWSIRATWNTASVRSSRRSSSRSRSALFCSSSAKPRSSPAGCSTANPTARNRNRFWQRGGGYDHNLWTPANVWERIKYIHENPVRRGLVEKPDDWQWSSYADYAGLRQGPLPLDRDSLPFLVQ